MKPWDNLSYEERHFVAGILEIKQKGIWQRETERVYNYLKAKLDTELQVTPKKK